ncbi:hypothetical protein M0R45_008451 [Rubus argutus]|uniref:Uncharacterized protein n=1 Tax=Rubus argutus TaxID=59490 RepID=A0AAW1Y194_RUBAR
MRTGRSCRLSTRFSNSFFSVFFRSQPVPPFYSFIFLSSFYSSVQQSELEGEIGEAWAGGRDERRQIRAGLELGAANWGCRIADGSVGLVLMVSF